MLALQRPSLALLPPSSLDTNDAVAQWDTIAALLAHTPQIDCTQIIDSVLPWMPTNPIHTHHHAPPMTPLEQKTLDFCDREFNESAASRSSAPRQQPAPTDFLLNLDNVIMKPLEAQMEVQMRELMMPPELLNRRTSSPKRTRTATNSTNPSEFQTPKTAAPNSQQATPVSIHHNHHSAVSTPVAPKRKSSALIISTPAVEKPREQAVDSETVLSQLVSKCASAICTLLKADDLVHAGQLESHPLLHPTTGFPTRAALENILRPFKRISESHNLDALVSALEEDEGEGCLGRVLKVCEKVLGGCECVGAFGRVFDKKGVREEEEEEGKEEGVVEREFEKMVEASVLGLEAAGLVLVVVNGMADGSSRQAYGEETIVSLIAFIKSRFNELFAMIRFHSDDSGSNDKKSRLSELLDLSETRKQCVRIATKLCDVLRLLTIMFSQQTFNDSLVISTYTTCVPTFFIEPNTFSTALGLEKLQLTCIQLLRSVFSQSSTHRIPILEEIAGHLVKLATVKKGLRMYKLRQGGRSVQMVSALVVVLVQSGFEGVEVEDVVKGVRECVGEAMGEGGGEEGVGSRERLGVEKLLSTAKHGIESAQSCGSFFLKYLLSRAFVDSAHKDKSVVAGGGGRKSLVSSSSESDLKSVLENLVQDFLNLMGEAEWPGADFMVLLFCKIMTNALDDKSTGDTALKSLALDFLGQLTSRLFSMSRVDRVGTKLEGGVDVAAVERFANTIQGPLVVEGGGALSESKVVGLWEVQGMLVRFLKEGRGDDAGFDVNPLLAVKLSTWCLFRRSPLQTIREPLLHYILANLDSDTITLRTRALKALSDVVAVDASVLGLGSVKGVIGQRLLDASKMVREAAVELVGGYLMKDGGEVVVREYYPLLVARMLDVGAGVRKRIIKLMKDLVASAVAKETRDGEAMPVEMSARVVEIVCKLMGRVSDEETSIQDLSLKCLAEIWFTPFKLATSQISGQAGKAGETLDAILGLLGKRNMAYTEQTVQAKSEIKSRVQLLLKVTLTLHHSASGVDAIGDVVKQLMEAGVVRRRELVVVSRSLVECLIELVLEAEERGDKETIKSSFMLLNQISRVLPQLLLPHVKMLHMYLKGNVAPTTPVTQNDRIAKMNEEQITAAVVSILGLVIPHAQDPDLNLMSAIESDLLVLMSKRSLAVVNLIVPTLSSFVHLVTKNYAKLTKVLRTCLDNFQKSRQMINAADPSRQGGALTPANERAIARGLIIVSLLVRNFDFDKHRGLLKDQAALDIQPCPNVLVAVCGYVSLFAGPTSSPDLKSIALQAL
ncbi:hypothetical protein HDU98_010660, partial [Podochytrium sp. JEL0797]